MTPAKRRKEANGQAEGGGEDQMAVTACPAAEAFVKQRRFELAVALEVADRGEGEDFTAGNTAGGGEIFTAGTAAGGEAVGDATAGGGAVGGADEGAGGCSIGISTPRVRANCLNCRRRGSKAS